VTASEWIASLSPWPEEFGLGRMHALLDALGNPQRAFRSVHVVGTNGKSTATRTIAALLRADGLGVGAYTSPHVSGWHERLDTDADGFERAVARVRSAAESVGATQFETLTAAAFADFAARGVDAAVVEAGLGGRLDATNVLDAPVVLLTNVALEHTDVLGDTRDQIAREKLAVVRAGATAVLPDGEWRHLVPDARVVVGGAPEAAEAFAGHELEAPAAVVLPGRLERRGPDEIRDGAHTPEAVDWLLAQIEPRDWTIVASILRDKDADAMLERLATAGRTLVATRSSNPRALDESELAARAERYFDRVEAVADPENALARGRELGPVLVTGSLYLLADLHESR
jgi:dihydrofolate synthase/folylpolyglutamate synthase